MTPLAGEGGAQAPQAKSALPLDGIRVFELGTVVAGPAAGLLLADLGADVVSIDNPRVDRFQAARPGLAYLRRNKRSLAIDLARPAGKNLFLDLLRSADVLVENYAPGSVDRLGLGYEAVSAINSRIVYCSIKGFLPGPYSGRVAADELAQMMGGLAYMTGLPGRPMRVGTSITDLGVASFATMAILAALLAREHTGRGQHIHGGLFETVAFWMSQHLANMDEPGQIPEPFSVRGAWDRMRWPIYDVFDVADGRQMFVGILNDKQWSSFCAEFELASLRNDPALQTHEQRFRSRQRLLDHLGPLFNSFASAELAVRLERAQVLFAPVNTPADLLTDPHLRATGRLLETEIEGKRYSLPALPFQSNAYRLGIRRQPPGRGQDTRSLLAEHGYDSERIAELCREGAIELPATD